MKTDEITDESVTDAGPPPAEAEHVTLDEMFGPDEPAVAAPEMEESPAAEEVAEAAVPAPEPEPPPPENKKKWYIVKVQSGREETIRQAIERKVKIEGLEEFFARILVPTEKFTEIRNNKRVTKERKKFPGYIMAEVEYNEKILYLFRETSGVGDFIRDTPNLLKPPTPMPDHEVKRMLSDQEGDATKGKDEGKPDVIILKYKEGDRVKVMHGSWEGMEGTVKQIIEPKDAKETVKIKVEVTVLSRPVLVECDYDHLETV